MEADVWVTRSEELLDIVDDRLQDLMRLVEEMIAHYKIECDGEWCPGSLSLEIGNVLDWAEDELWRRDQKTAE